MSRITIKPLGRWSMRFYTGRWLISRDRVLLERRRAYTERLAAQRAVELQTIKEVNKESIIYAQIIQHCLARLHFVYAPSEGYQSAAGQRKEHAQYVQYQAIRTSSKIIWYRILINYRTLYGGYKDALPYGVYTGNIVKDETLFEISAACGRQVEADFDITAPNEGVWLKVYRMEGVGGLPLQVGFREMLEHYPADMRRGTVVLGVGLYHNVHHRNLDDFSHMLLAGATRSGKSNMLNNLICGQLLFTDPSDLRIVLIDLKHLEFVHYKGSPHLYCDIITEADEAIEALIKLDEEMQRRQRLMETVLAKKLIEWNAKCPDQKMPRILVIIDEYAALMLTSGRRVKAEVQKFIQHGTNIGAATGVHFWVCTQHPVSDVIDNSVKTNMQLVVGGRTQNWQQSMTVLGQRGLESLPLTEPKGRMIYQFGAEQHEIQTPYITNDDISWCVAISRGRGAGILTMDGIEPAIVREGMIRWVADHGGSLRQSWVEDELHKYAITLPMWRTFVGSLIKDKEVVCDGTIYEVRRLGQGYSLVAIGKTPEAARAAEALPPSGSAQDDDSPTEEPGAENAERDGESNLSFEEKNQRDGAVIDAEQERKRNALETWRTMMRARRQQNGAEVNEQP